jgi:plastocyanin
MSRAFGALVACSALALAAGCGSSGGSSAPTAATATGASGAGATSTGGLKASTTPKYGSPSPAAPVQSGLVQVAYRNIAIAPDTLRVRVGSTVRWTNYDSVEHNVTSTGGPAHLASATFGEGGHYEVKLTRPGIIHYVCTIHPTSMNGTIEVVR